MMDWPPQSPDLNPIELLWEQIDRKVREKCPTSTSHWELLQKAWGEDFEYQGFARLSLLQLEDFLMKAKYEV